MRNVLGDSPAWSALLPDDTVRLAGRGPGGARRFRRIGVSVPEGRTWTMVGAPWTHGRNPPAGTTSNAQVVHSYVTYPREMPVVIASKDAAVLRYVANSVLSVPPGAGRVPSMLFTSGLRMLRRPIMWTFASIVRAAGTVLVGKSE
jgi:hypothetical protein